MAWNEVKSINTTVNSYPGYSTRSTSGGEPDPNGVYIAGHYYLKFVGKLYVDSENSSHYRLQLTCSVTNKYQNWGGYWSSNGGYGIKIEFSGNKIHSQQINTPLSVYSNPGTYSTFANVDFDFNISSSGTLKLKTQVFKGGAGRVGSQSALPANCKGATASQGFSGSYSNFIDYEIPDPYKPPSVNILDYNLIGRLGYEDWWAKYKVNKGTDAIQWSRIHVWRPNNTDYNKDFNGNNSGEIQHSYTVPSGDVFEHGKKYSAEVSTYDGKNEVWTGRWDIYTYTWPDLSEFSINKSKSGNSYTISGDQSWTVTLSGTNNRNFNTLENEFETHHYITNGSNAWANKGNVTSYTNNASYEGTQITDAKDGQAVTYNVSRYASSPKYRTSKTASIIFYYRPRYPATDYMYYKNNTSGTNYPHGETVVNDNTLSGIYVKWNSTTSDAKTYGTTKKDDAGQVDGYRIELREKYANGTYSGVYKTYYVSAGNATIPKADIRKLVMQQIRITPYYIHSSTEKWYYNSPEWKDFIILRSPLNTPVISYPKNNTTWHNRDLRVLFQLPVDPDKNEEESTYKYNNVEIEVTNQVGTKYYVCMRDTVGRTSGGTVSNACFNINNTSDAVNNLTYQRKMVCAPSIASNYPFDSATKLKYRVRVQSRWIPTSAAPMWSAWSNQVTINIATISFNPSVGDYIMATHYNTMITKAKTAYDVYPGFTWTKPTNVVAKSTIIKADQYKVPFASPVGIKNFVNSGYGATFDTGYEKAKFDYSGKIVNFDPVAARYEYVTALTDPRPNPKGRDYIKMVYDWLNYLKD